MTNDTKAIAPANNNNDAFLNIAAIVSSVAPWVGGPVSTVLSGVLTDRKIQRVREVLEGFANDLKDYKSQASKDYVHTEDFEDLLGETLHRVSKERSEERRKSYLIFLTQSVKNPNSLYDEQIRFLDVLDQLQPNDFQILHALNREPEDFIKDKGTFIGTLSYRLPEVNPELINDSINRLNNLGLTQISNPNMLMDGIIVQNTKHRIAPFGHRFINFMKQE